MLFRPSLLGGTAAVLAALCAGLTLFAAKELTDPRYSLNTPPREAKSAAGSAQPDTREANFALPPLSQFAAVAERPLFSPDRRAPQPSPENPGDWSSFILAGIIITPQTREIIVLHGNPPVVAHLQEGQTLDGWTLSSIQSDHAVFRNALTQHDLTLPAKSAPRTAGTRARVSE